MFLTLLRGRRGRGAFGIANERRWGYRLGVAHRPSGALLAGPTPARHRPRSCNLVFLISIVFPVALFCAARAPESRDYQRIWFR